MMSTGSDSLAFSQKLRYKIHVGRALRPLADYPIRPCLATVSQFNFLSEKVEFAHRWGKDLSGSAMHQLISPVFTLFLKR